MARPKKRTNPVNTSIYVEKSAIGVVEVFKMDLNTLIEDAICMEAHRVLDTMKEPPTKMTRALRQFEITIQAGRNMQERYVDEPVELPAKKDPVPHKPPQQVKEAVKAESGETYKGFPVVMDSGIKLVHVFDRTLDENRKLEFRVFDMYPLDRWQQPVDFDALFSKK